MTGSLTPWLNRAESDPAGLPDEGYVALLGAEGPELEVLTTLADAVRTDAVGDALTVVANRNLETAVVADDPGLLDALVDEAVALGATEICLQGPLPANAPDDGYLGLVRRITGRAPLHLHAFRPAEVDDAATRAGSTPRAWLTAAREAGLGSVPGTAARILDDRVRARMAGRPDLPVARWLELITTAHDVGLRSTATMVYGHVETPAQQVAHLRTLAEVQDRTGGFTEFIAMPLLPDAVGDHLRADYRGPDERETRALHAVARLLLHGRISHLQVAWTKLPAELLPALLCGGADDLGGLLLDGTVRPDAGPEAGRELTVDDVGRLATALDRTVRQRTTTYGDPPPERRLVPSGAPA
jgi:CofH subfamily radical SAM domain protein